MLARWSWPRFRYDQLMDLAWKVMIPWGLVNLVAVAVAMEYGGDLARLIGLSPDAAWRRSDGQPAADVAGDRRGRSHARR